MNPQSRIAALVHRPWLWALFFAIALAVHLGRAIATPAPPALPELYSVPAFAFTDQQGRHFSSGSLKGKVWVANFIFTRCPTVCPLLTSQMAQVQQRTRNLGEAVHLVSFTVDPEHDTPEKLAAFARQYQAGPRSWSFLTGPREALQATLVDGLKVHMTRDGPADDLMSIGHANKFVLVDGQMRVRGYYGVEEPGALDRLVRDVGALINRG
ncbi:MAG TPA: SCO family protein [Myxococcaceae bacterium]|nr:SCO family protein [Myxococcaceae bacterium]